MIGLPSPLAVVCHDAGAANLILAWLATEALPEIRAVMQGPAAALWQAAQLPRPSFATPEQALKGAAALLSGTGWASDLEHQARRLARERGLRSIAVIDHWVNYPARFERHGEVILPDEFWVTDEDALAEARRCFPGHKIVRQPNTYLDTLVSTIGPAGSDHELLYVLEPARSDWGRLVPGEFQALDYFVQNRHRLPLHPGTRVRLRPHPSDPPGKYEDWLRRHPPKFTLDTSTSLSAALARAQWVVGCESFALVVALAAGRRVVCTLPPWAPACRLPHAGLLHLKQATLDPI
ncbi:hypothetical protein [Polaromonas sp.]|uniref:hypothetical protein n=1 Tax=Polaromonas sp. TaxID=1869339 RepID=UPI003BACCAF2